MSDSNSKDVSTIGKHCSFESCNRLDFLPVKCELCHFNYCKEHYSFESHQCAKYEEKNKQNLTKVAGSSRIKFYDCTFEECKQKEMVQVICEFCDKRLCMKHRLQIDHKCPKLDSNLVDLRPKEAKKEFKFEMKQNVSEKNASLAAKLTLMKLKQTAVGPPGLPELSKYFCFIIQDGEQSSKKPFFFSIKWPVGKCIDFLIEKLKIQKSKQNNLKLFLDSSHVPSSSTIEELQKNNVLANHGLILNLTSC
ncbi:AN1-type zinc finger 1 [Brachionus plicatilis]|uniref:AN1-type zinc finger 1 n=1 Tax=Brachionus plicatilis TaxID=10195 RepID=A0A3M7SCZ4_BRAPC|nr:AN1-type zinc finger 1 [Brachionus plicatilis]